MSLLSRGNIHQGHEGFSGQSREKQCSFMSLSSLLTAQTIPVIEWNSTTIYNVLVQVDNMYLNLIPRKEFLSLSNLPTVVCCRWLEDKSNNSSIETCRSISDRHKYIIIYTIMPKCKFPTYKCKFPTCPFHAALPCDSNF